MPYLTQLADVARRTGYPVTEVPGWRSRGHGPQPEVDGVVCHHTAGWNDMHVVRDGRPGLEGPLSQIWLRRDGTIFIVAAGRCWHNAPSLSLGHTNGHSIGIEAENDGRTAWPAAQLDSYRKLCAELCLEFGLSASAVKGHKEVNASKPDPHSINMTTFRAEVARLMKGDDMPSAKEIADAVYERFTHTVTEDLWAAKEKILEPGQKIDPRSAFRQIWAYGKDGYARDREILARLDAQGVAIKALVEVIAARDEEIDVEALVDRIETAIEGITVRLDVPDAPAPKV
ncbi:peptidoglycan recognition family protein [Streptosporangium sp. NPDC048865]|uniref:peptidoglycan recognition protein family protein n=1 Tax=Streptosporangium sp. NPDC048865 TaxID=3155766 RepID=UPI00341A63EA